MRLFKPTEVFSNKKLYTISALIVLVIGGALIYRHFHANHIVIATEQNINDLQIQRYQNSKDTNDKRVLISAYENKGDYQAAHDLAMGVAQQTKTLQDYMAVLNICALHNVANKSSCINDIATTLEPLIPQMTFTTAYSAGILLEKNNHKKDAAAFYQRAYDTYTFDPKAENLMSQGQLKAHIDELRK